MDALFSISVQQVQVSAAREVIIEGKHVRWHVDPSREVARIQIADTLEGAYANAFEAGRRYGQLESTASVFEPAKADGADSGSNIKVLQEPIPSCPQILLEPIARP